MSYSAKLSLCVLCALSLGVALGCKKEESKPAAPAAAPADNKAQPPADPAAPAADPPKTGAVMPEIEKALAKLSPEDRTLAEKQKICPVSNHPLGSMDTPKKITVAGQEVFICCAGCEQSLRDEPEKYLAVIGLKPAAQ